MATRKRSLLPALPWGWSRRLCRRVCCDWLGVHRGSIESYGRYSYIDCERCGTLTQPMPRGYAEIRYGGR